MTKLAEVTCPEECWEGVVNVEALAPGERYLCPDCGATLDYDAVRELLAVLP